MARVVGTSTGRKTMRPNAAPARRRVDAAAPPVDGGATWRWVGTRVRHARLVKRLRIRDVAEQVGCSMSVISKIENGKATPSLTLLHRLVNVLGINIGALFEASEDATAAVLRAGTRPVIALEPISRGAGVALERLVPYGDGHLLQGNIHIIAPGGGSDGGMEHEGEEVGYVLEGALSLTLDGRTYELGAGDSFAFRSNRQHGYRNPGKTVTRILWINTPPTF
jgi:transcriptional regulator with XRE-family HTH domain